MICFSENSISQLKISDYDISFSTSSLSNSVWSYTPSNKNGDIFNSSILSSLQKASKSFVSIYVSGNVKCVSLKQQQRTFWVLLLFQATFISSNMYRLNKHCATFLSCVFYFSLMFITVIGIRQVAIFVCVNRNLKRAQMTELATF